MAKRHLTDMARTNRLPDQHYRWINITVGCAERSEAHLAYSFTVDLMRLVTSAHPTCAPGSTGNVPRSSFITQVNEKIP